MQTCKRWWMLILLLWPSPDSRATAPAEFYLKDGQTVVFVGDSNTFADQYIQYLDAFLFTRFPEKRFHLINRGLPSETVAGTSEPTHIPPRPDLHTRFSRTVPPLHPDVLVACYGMNDGVYSSTNDEIFARYQSGIRRLVQRTHDETKAGLVLLTPPPFDVAPYRNKPPTDPPDWRRPASDYDATLGRFSDWLLGLRKENLFVVDLRTPVGEFLKDRRRSDPGFILAGDGVHLNATGHWLIAQSLLRAWSAPAVFAEVVIDVNTRRALAGEVAGLEIGSKGRLGFRWSLPLPCPIDPACDAASLALARSNERLNQCRLVVRGAPEERYDVVVGRNRLGLVTREALAQGVNLADYSKFPLRQESQEVLKLVQRRRQILLEAWVRDDPHPRLAGMFKNSKATIEEAEALEARLRQLCQKQTIAVQLQPIEEQGASFENHQ